MANKKPMNSKYEVEIEKLRNENKWDKLRDYVKVLPKDSKYGFVFFFSFDSITLTLISFSRAFIKIMSK
jgi:hypothetical protein